MRGSHRGRRTASASPFRVIGTGRGGSGRLAPDGTDLKALTSGSFDDREPHWSPDGTTIAFSSDRSGNYDIWVLDVASGQVTPVTKNPANDFLPTWSPDGREIAFVSIADAVTRRLRDHASTDVSVSCRASRDAVGTPSWAPDGKQVLFSVLPGWRLQRDRPDAPDARRPVDRVGRGLLPLPRAVALGRRIPLHRRTARSSADRSRTPAPPRSTSRPRCA